ncbi:probable pre-mRNA-splicing factor ATP-dependent RNA helicase DEAH6 [Glycine soja]|uniref:probable pre-mRNA-splicing factor ATP-dependent RNA helicase DEAH6 n=1 Tax=Glycine soja TaxID=3848 RepID=UPI00103E4915|nr:probable pre-mRNA-splicing factor ATP-dependent RNA helicase DEAH6 [Glycine soja]
MIKMMRQCAHNLLDSFTYFLLMVILRKEKERQVKRRTSPNEVSDSESEEERLKDQREKEELEQHMRERDAAGTRKLTEQKLTRKEEAWKSVT